METNEKTVLIRNSFEPTQEHYAQAYRAMMKTSDILTLGFVALMALILVLSSVLTKLPLFSFDNLVPLIAIGVAVIAALMQHFLLPNLYARNAQKRLLEAYGKTGALTVTVYDDSIVMHNGANDGEIAFAFNAFTKFSETQDLLLMRTRARQTVMLAKANFEQGDEASFKTLMKEKCPAAKFSWK